jgi:hypothetical protein
MNWTLILEITTLIVAIIGLVPIYFLVKTKTKKRYKFDLKYGNIFFATFLDSDNRRLDGRLCLVVYALSIVNSSDEPNTLKDIILSYRFGGKRYQTVSYVVPNGKSPAGEPAIAITNMIDNIILVGWHNARVKLGKNELLQPGCVFSGSAVFLFEPHIIDLHNLRKLTFIVNDYYGHKSAYTLGEDGSVHFTRSSGRKGA